MTGLSKGAVLVMVAALTGCASKTPATPPRTADAAIDWSKAKEVDVGLSDFEFTPSRLTFTAGQPVRLMLANTGSDRHDFSAPAFFADAAFRSGGTLPVKGGVSLAKDQKAEIDLVPGKPGQYELDCTEFLHDMFGMTGHIAVQ
ncbi:MAG TPA: cupredoxin domain-containing protein [Alphaproteobacteria bacterium]|nr:cupredoxin domain-containing protein [Alphaproteobacteria bacterium]